MAIKVLGISTSPRIEGNSDLLLRHALAGAEATGARVEYVRLADHQIGPCTECNACYQTGTCTVQDDYPKLLKRLLDTDRLIFATPVFFMGVCAQAKMLIDRGQCLWAQKYVLKNNLLPRRPDRQAMVIAVGGSRSRKQFECIRLMMASYLDSLQMHYVSNLFVSRVDARGAIENHLSAATEAYRLGARLAAPDAAAPEKPVTIELT